MARKEKLKRPVLEGLNSMTLDQWRTSSDHTVWARDQMATSQKFRDMVSVIRNTAVYIDPSKLDGVNSAYALGVMKGIESVYLSVLLLSKLNMKPDNIVEPDYGQDPSPE